VKSPSIASIRFNGLILGADVLKRQGYFGLLPPNALEILPTAMIFIRLAADRKATGFSRYVDYLQTRS